MSKVYKTEGPYWHEFESRNCLPHEKEAGKWVVFHKKAYNGLSNYEETKFIESLKLLCNATLIGRVWVSVRFDVVLVFTSADRKDIWNSKQEAVKCTGLKADSFIWKAHFETDNHWERDTGNFWLISELDDAQHRTLQYIKASREEKAKRIQEYVVPRLLSEIRRLVLEETTMNRTSMVITPSFPVPEYELDPTLIFLIMPFSEAWSDDVFYLVKSSAEAHGMKVVRADEIFSPDIVINDIWKQLNRAGLVIADITRHNANVFYELGIAHTLGKRVVMLRQDGGENAPFDISYWRYFNYALSPIKAEEFKETLGKILQKHLTDYELAN